MRKFFLGLTVTPSDPATFSHPFIDDPTDPMDPMDPSVLSFIKKGKVCGNVQTP